MHYNTFFENHPKIHPISKDFEATVPHIYVVRIEGLTNREVLQEKLLEKGIQTGIHYNPIHKMSMYNSRIKLPNTENITSQIVTLPTHPNLTRDDVSLIVDLINEFGK